ncbi:MAG: helix-turn-helix domain-containing protein [Patescibacteria group bacterium]
MQNNAIPSEVYTPDQVAKILQLSKNTVYELIHNGEIVAKKLGKVYRIPASSLSFLFTGIDSDLHQAQQLDEKNLSPALKKLKTIRKKIWIKSQSI